MELLNEKDRLIEIIGRRAGEKLYEELMTEDEAENAYEDEEMFVVLPQNVNIVDETSYKLHDNFEKTQRREYSSESVELLTKEEIRALIKRIVVK